jgi:outer membrane protein TolC
MAAIQLDQTLLNWSYIEGIKALKPNEELVKLKKVQTEEQVIYNTISAYYSILLLSENEKLLKQSEVRISKTLPIVKLQYEKGVIKKMDVDRVQVNYNNIVANLDILKTRKEVAYNNLKYNMAMPLDSSIAIDTNYSKDIVDLKNYTDTANVKNRIDLKVLRQSLLLNQINYRRTKAAYYPVLTFNAKYGGLSQGNKFGDAFSKWTQFGGIGMQLNVPIFDGLRNSSALKQMAFSIASLKETIAQTEEGLKLQMLNANTDLSSAVTTLASNKQTMELAESIYNTTTLQYQKGVIGYTDLLSAEYAYKESESNYLQSLVKYLSAKLDADRSNNNLNAYKN